MSLVLSPGCESPSPARSPGERQSGGEGYQLRIGTSDSEPAQHRFGVTLLVSLHVWYSGRAVNHVHQAKKDSKTYKRIGLLHMDCLG